MISSFITESHNIFWKSDALNSIEEAEIICMGESHIDLDGIKKNASLIDKIIKFSDPYKKSIVLVETGTLQEINPKIHPQTQYITAPIKCQGWDINRTQETLEENRIKYNDIILRLEEAYKKRAHLSDPQITKTRRRGFKREALLNKLRSMKVMNYKKYLIKQMMALYKNEKTKKYMIPLERGSVMNTEEIESLVWNTINNVRNSIVLDKFQIRNNSMIKMIDEKADSVVFVLAGLGHFGIYNQYIKFNEFPEKWSEDFKKKLSPEPLYNFLNTKKAIVLSPKK